MMAMAPWEKRLRKLGDQLVKLLGCRQDIGGALHR